MSIDSVMPSNHLILCHPLLLSPLIFPSIRVFPNESHLRMRWPKYWSFSFSISPSNERSGLISFRWTGWISLQSKGLSRVFSNTTVQKHQFFNELSLNANYSLIYELVHGTPCCSGCPDHPNPSSKSVTLVLCFLALHFSVLGLTSWLTSHEFNCILPQSKPNGNVVILIVFH